VNDLATFYMSILLLPQLRKVKIPGRLVIVSSSTHYWTSLDEDVLNAPSIYQKMSEKDYNE
jgi:hypothetical protein